MPVHLLVEQPTERVMRAWSAKVGNMPALTTLLETRVRQSVTALRARWRCRLPDATPALLAYLAVRTVGLIALWISSRRSGADMLYLLSDRFDATWYRQIADVGYDAVIPRDPSGILKTTNLAFFPLYPGLI